MSAPIVVLAGGTGGAKLARGVLDIAGADLVVIANTGDDIEIHGGHVSPDPDLVTFWLADRVDERGWGLRDDTFKVMEALRALGEEVWFNLGDQDLAICLARARQLAGGATPTAAADGLRRALGVPARVLPMSDSPVRTQVQAGGVWRGLQEWLIRERAAGPVEGVEFAGAEDAAPSAAVLAALDDARAVIVGPSNPVISIGPILALPGLREAVSASPAPVVAVSPFVGGGVVKGPTAAFCAWAGLPLDARALLEAYAGLLDGVVADEPLADARVETLQIDTLMDSPQRRRAVARATLDFARSLGG